MSAKTTTSAKPAVKRANCSGCNHSASFHSSGQCKVMACPCQKWNGPKVTRKAKKK